LPYFFFNMQCASEGKNDKNVDLLLTQSSSDWLASKARFHAWKISKLVCASQNFRFLCQNSFSLSKCTFNLLVEPTAKIKRYHKFTAFASWKKSCKLQTFCFWYIFDFIGWYKMQKYHEITQHKKQEKNQQK